MEKLIVIRTLAELIKLEEYLADKEYISYDTETTGLKRGSEIIGFSVCADIEVGYYVITSAWDVDKQELISLPTKERAAHTVGLLRGKKLIMHNAIFDCRITKDNYAIDLMPSLFQDTLVSGHLIDENQKKGLKDRGAQMFGEDAKTEMIDMRQSVQRNGGSLTKDNYELYKADAEVIAKYGAKDAILTLKLFYQDVLELDKQQLDGFFYEDESMPLLRGPTFDLNTTGLLVDQDRLKKLRGELEAEIIEAKAFVHKEIYPNIKDKYPGTSPKTTFNPNSGEQLAWLLFVKMEQECCALTAVGKKICKVLDIKIPYTNEARREFIEAINDNVGRVYAPAGTYDPKTKRTSKRDAVIVGKYWKYMSTGKATLKKFSERYKWVEKLLELKKADKLLGTYVEGITSRLDYGIIYPEFNQCGTTSGRFSCKNPNFQNLPRGDKRIKACIIARPGKVFVGADYSQLEPRVFASHSGDERLQACFKNDDDFYSVVGVDVFDVKVESLKKDHPMSFASLYEEERQKSKVLALAAPYGQTPAKLAPELKCTMDEARDILDRYFEAWPKVKDMQLRAHAHARRHGVVYNLFGRPRRIPRALSIDSIFGPDTKHAELPYDARTLLNLAVNHEIQSTGASIMNRAAIAVWRTVQELGSLDAKWLEVKIVLQVHDELILEAPEELAEDVAAILRDCMENTVILPGVALQAVPKIAKDIAGLK